MTTATTELPKRVADEYVSCKIRWNRDCFETDTHRVKFSSYWLNSELFGWRAVDGDEVRVHFKWQEGLDEWEIINVSRSYPCRFYSPKCYKKAAQHNCRVAAMEHLEKSVLQLRGASRYLINLAERTNAPVGGTPSLNPRATKAIEKNIESLLKLQDKLWNQCYPKTKSGE